MSNIISGIDKGVLTITVNRPDKLNALNHQTIQEIGKAVADGEKNPEVRGMIITGSGVKAFVAGADISEFASYSIPEAKKLSADGHVVFDSIENCTKPIIAAVNGFALGGGCELAMSCHLRVASSNAKFGQPEVKLGLIPGYAGTQRLVQLIGKGKALELLMSAEMIGADEALQFVRRNSSAAPTLDFFRRSFSQSPSRQKTCFVKSLAIRIVRPSFYLLFLFKSLHTKFHKSSRKV